MRVSESVSVSMFVSVCASVCFVTIKDISHVFTACEWGSETEGVRERERAMQQDCVGVSDFM